MIAEIRIIKDYADGKPGCSNQAFSWVITKTLKTIPLIVVGKMVRCLKEFSGFTVSVLNWNSLYEKKIFSFLTVAFAADLVSSVPLCLRLRKQSGL